MCVTDRARREAEQLEAAHMQSDAARLADAAQRSLRPAAGWTPAAGRHRRRRVRRVRRRRSSMPRCRQRREGSGAGLPALVRRGSTRSPRRAAEDAWAPPYLEYQFAVSAPADATERDSARRWSPSSITRAARLVRVRSRSRAATSKTRRRRVPRTALRRAQAAWRSCRRRSNSTACRTCAGGSSRTGAPISAASTRAPPTCRCCCWRSSGSSTATTGASCRTTCRSARWPTSTGSSSTTSSACARSIRAAGRTRAWTGSAGRCIGLSARAGRRRRSTAPAARARGGEDRRKAIPSRSVIFARDEMTNMVWGVEERIPGVLGLGVDGFERATALSRLFPQRVAGQRARRPNRADATIRYVLGNTVPENWIPFIATREPGLAATDPAAARVDAAPHRRHSRQPRRAARRACCASGLDGVGVPRSRTSCTRRRCRVPASSSRAAFSARAGSTARCSRGSGGASRPGAGRARSGLEFDRTEPGK